MKRASWRSREGVVGAVVAAVVVCLRVGLGWRNEFCGTPDACNYLGVAQSLGSGQGFSARFLFDLQQDTLQLPTRAIEYWRPGTSFFLLLARPFGGVTLHSSMVVAVLSVVALSAAAWVLAMRATGSRWVALASFLLCLLLPPAWSESMTADSGMFYGLAVAWFLVLFAVRRCGVAQDVAALGFVALTYAIRNDGVLLLVPLLAVLWQRRRLGLPGSSLGYAAAMVVGFGLALAPMHLLNKAVLGQAFPSGAGRALYVDSFDSFMQYRQPVNLHTLLATGFRHLLLVRVMTFASVVYRNLALGIGFAVVFLPAVWMGRRRRPQADREATAPELTGGIAFLLAILAMYTLVMPVIGEFSALRAFYGLLPLASVLVVVGVARMVPEKKLAAGLIVSVLAAYGVAGVMADRRELAELAAVGEPMRVLGEELQAAGVQPGEAVLMTESPVQISVTTGFATVAIPSNGEAAMRGLAGELRVTDVLVNAGYTAAQTERMRAALQPVSEVVLPKSHVLVLRLARR